MITTGTGTGAVTYQILDGPAVNARNCNVKGAEDNDAGRLTLNISFVDATYGDVQLEISILNYSPSETMYKGDALSVSCLTQNPSGKWEMRGENSAFLDINKKVIKSAVTYSGFLETADLVCSGPGNQGSIGIKILTFMFILAGDRVTADDSGYYSVNGNGVGTTTYMIGAASSETEDVQVTSVSYYDDEQIYAVELWANWTDPAQGSTLLWLTVWYFTGTGTYDVTVVFSTNAAGPGAWTGDGTLDATYLDNGAGLVDWAGTLVANQMTWNNPNSTQPNLDLNMTALTLTINNNS